jgi:hypothetical protein
MTITRSPATSSLSSGTQIIASPLSQISQSTLSTSTAVWVSSSHAHSHTHAYYHAHSSAHYHPHCLTHFHARPLSAVTRCNWCDGGAECTNPRSHKNHKVLEGSFNYSGEAVDLEGLSNSSFNSFPSLSLHFNSLPSHYRIIIKADCPASVLTLPLYSF